MTNTEMLKDFIEKSGYRIQFLCDQLGITRQGLYNKINGKTEFNASEISILTELLKLTAEQQRAIFFAQFVDKQST